MLRELKTHNPKYADRLIEYYRLKHRNLSEQSAIDELEYMFDNCGNLLHEFVNSLDIESICIEHSEKFVDFIIERMEKRNEKA